MGIHFNIWLEILPHGSMRPRPKKNVYNSARCMFMLSTKGEMGEMVMMHIFTKQKNEKNTFLLYLGHKTDEKKQATNEATAVTFP